MARAFLRADTFRHSRLGKNRKKLQKWRRPRGKHNKLRLKRAGHPPQPGIGYGSPRSEEGRIQGKIPYIVHNLHELEVLSEGSIAILARVGAKKKIDLLKKAQELNIPIANLGGRKK